MNCYCAHTSFDNLNVTKILNQANWNFKIKKSMAKKLGTPSDASHEFPCWKRALEAS